MIRQHIDKASGAGRRQEEELSLQRALMESMQPSPGFVTLPPMRQATPQKTAPGGKDGKSPSSNPDFLFRQSNPASPAADIKGLSVFELSRLIPQPYSPTPSCPTECQICLVDFATGQSVQRLQCLHTFHSHCIAQWLGKKPVCPECRFDLRSIDFDRFA